MVEEVMDLDYSNSNLSVPSSSNKKKEPLPKSSFMMGLSGSFAYMNRTQQRFRVGSMFSFSAELFLDRLLMLFHSPLRHGISSFFWCPNMSNY